MAHPPPVPHGPPPGAPPQLPATRGPGPLLFVLIVAVVVAVVLLVAGVVGYAVATRDDASSSTSSGPVDLSEPLTFKLVEEVSEHPCKAGALTARANASCYTFGSDELTVRRLEKIKAAAPDPASGGTGWTVQVTLTSADTSGFAELTGKAAEGYASRLPSARMGMLVGGQLISEPAQVMRPITGGEVQISGGADKFTRAYTENLVHRMVGE